MMPGETHSKVAGIASEATASCQNCTSLQQSLNEYVAALIILKQKIIDSDHLLAEYQQKCDNLQCAKRENETLRCQLEQILQKGSPQEQTEKELILLRAQLEEKETTLKAFQQTQLECVKVKEECEKDHFVKKKLEVKLKKIKEAAEKHVNNIKQLQLEKKVIEKELKKMQKKLDGIQNEKCKKAGKNAKAQVVTERPVVKLNKKKIKILLEELWSCIESSTENGEDDQLILETKLESSNLNSCFDCTSSVTHSSPSIVLCNFNTSSKSTFVHESNEFAHCTQYKKRNSDDMTIEECVGVGVFCEKTSQNVLKDLNDTCSFTSDHENDMEELMKILSWAKPLPHVLSPLKLSPLTTKHVFGEFPDSSDELSDKTVANANMHCKTPDKITSVQHSCSILSVTGLENVPESCKQSHEFWGSLESATVAYGIKSQSDSASSSEVGEKNSTETLVPITELSSINNSKDDISRPVGNKNCDSMNKPVDAEDFLGTMEMKNIQDSEKNGSGSGACHLPLSCSTAINCNTTEFPKDSFLHNLYPNEMVNKECDITSIFQDMPNTGNIHVNFRKNVSPTVTCDGQDTTQFPKCSEMCLSSKSNYPFITVQSNMFGQNKTSTDLDCPKANSLENLNSTKFDTTSVNEEMPFIDDKVYFSYMEPEQKSMHLNSTPITELEHEHTEMLVQCSVAKTGNLLPVFMQDISVKKSSRSPEQNVPLKMNKGGGQCYKERFDFAVGSGVEFTSTLAENVFYVDGIQTKMTPNELELVALDTENCVKNKNTDRQKCTIYTDSRKKKPNQQAFKIQTDKVQEPNHDSCQIDTTGKYVNQQCRISSSEPVKQLPSSAYSSHDSPKVENIVMAEVQSLQTEMHVNKMHSHSEAVSNYSVCLENNGQLHSPILLQWNDKVTANFDAAIANNVAPMSKHQFTQEVEDLVSDGNDKNNINTCKGAMPNKDAEPDLASEKTGAVHSLSRNNTLYVEFSQSKLPPASKKELHPLNQHLVTNKTFNKANDKGIGNEDIFGVSLDSEDDDHFLVRKVSNTRAVSNSVYLIKSCKSSLENIDEKFCNVVFGLDGTPCNPISKRLIHEDCARDLPACVDSSINVIQNAENTVKKYSNDQRKESALSIESKRREDSLVSEPNIYTTTYAVINLNTFETDPRKTLPGKNWIWNFGRTDDLTNLRDVLGKQQKLKANSENIHVSSDNCLSRVSVNTDKMPKTLNSIYKVKPVRKEENQQRVSEGENLSQTFQVRQTVLANADISSSSACSLEINKVRSEMGPPLPPLLGPLLATPPKIMHPLSPTMSCSSFSSLSSPLDNLIPPLLETQFPPLVSPLSAGCKHSLSLTTISSAEKANQRILSSPLQFCSATPKHALPVPGRLPTTGSSATSVQENSVKILDTIYPELSARARTLNILKGNVQLNRGLPDNCKNVHVSPITGFKPITSTSTAFMKAVSNSSTDNHKAKLRSFENQKLPSNNSSLNKRTMDSFLMPKSAKRLRLESPVMETVKDHSKIPAKDIEVKPSRSWHISYSRQLLPDVVKDSSVDEDVITNALKKVEDLCFDLLPVIRSHIFVGTIPKVPVMRNEEMEVIYYFSNSKKSLADRFLHVVLKKIRAGKASMPSACLQALCRVYVGLCRQLGDIERARILCYSILKEEFPDPDRLLLFIVSSWNDILSTHGVVSKAIQAILRTLANEEVGYCLSAYLSWEKACTPSMNVSVLLSSVLMAIQLYPDVKFQQSEKYGEDLTDSIWEYVFAVDLLCSHRKWVWTHDNVISKELWPLLDKWVKRKKGNPNVTFVPDIIVAAVLRLVGRLCQMGLKEGFVTAVKNISAVIIKFLQHANEEGMPWGMQLACVYMLCDLAPSNPATICKTLQAWKVALRNDIPLAIGSCMQEAELTCELKK